MYNPNPVPTNPQDLIAYLSNEMDKLRNAINSKVFIPLSVRHAAPTKPKPGLYAADGTNWSPGGGGAGVYYFDGTTYTKL